MSDLPPPVPAATLIVMRDSSPSAPELLMMERSGRMAFAAGALVFPGGRVDAQDRAAAALLGDGSDLAAAKIAAVRETIEETGMAVGLDPAPDEGQLVAIRERLLAGDPFARLLGEGGLSLDLDALEPFARWCPNFKETRRFDAWFFVARAPEGAGKPTPQAGEVTRTFWATATEVLADLDGGRAHAIFPTRRNLERLAQFGSYAQARQDARRHEVRTVTPWVEQRDGREWLCIPDGIGYPVTAELLDTARRG